MELPTRFPDLQALSKLGCIGAENCKSNMAVIYARCLCFFHISCLDFCSVKPICVNDKEVFNYMTAVSASRSRGSVTGLELVG